MSLHRGKEVHLCGPTAEWILEARWSQVWLVLGWDLPVLALLWAQHPEHA